MGFGEKGRKKKESENYLKNPDAQWWRRGRHVEWTLAGQTGRKAPICTSGGRCCSRPTAESHVDVAHSCTQHNNCPYAPRCAVICHPPFSLDSTPPPSHIYTNGSFNSPTCPCLQLFNSSTRHSHIACSNFQTFLPLTPLFLFAPFYILD